MISAFGVEHISKAAEDGKRIKAGKNDLYIRSRGERKAYRRGATPGYVASVAGLGVAGGALVTGFKNKSFQIRQSNLNFETPSYGKQVKHALKSKSGKVYAAGLGTAVAGSVASTALGHKNANKWRKKEGVGERGWWSGKPKKDK